MTFVPRLGSLFRDKALTYAVEAFLAAIGGFGLWQWLRTPWETSEALVRVFVQGALPLALCVVVALQARAGARRVKAAAGFQMRIDHLMKRMNAQDDFFRLLMDSSPSTVSVFNARNEYCFVNGPALRALGGDVSQVSGRTPSAVQGAEKGRKVERHLDHVRETGKPIDILRRDAEPGGAVRFAQVKFMPVPSTGDFPGGVLVREDDVTPVLVEREKREAIFRQVIATLVAVVDRRDPYASGHSSRVGLLARGLAGEMQLSESDIEVAEVAGSLMNFGKVLVSRSILTKMEVLTPDELQRIRDGIMTSADILAGIDFGGPVAPTLRQVLERFDGTGAPAGVKGDAIMITARIVAVANAFIALVSPRAYRDGLPFDEAARRLSEDAGKAFDPRVMIALDNFLRRNAGKLEWLVGAKARVKSPL